MKKYTDNLAYGIIFMLVITITVLISMGIFLDKQNAKEVRNISKIYMEGVSRRISQYFATVTDLHLGQVESMVKETEGSDSSAVIEAFMHDADIFNFDYLGFYYGDGSYEPIKGEMIGFVNPQSLNDSLRETGKKVTMARNSAGANIVTLCVAANYAAADRPSPALVGGYDANYFIDELSLNSEGVVFNTTIIRKDGSFVLRSSGEYSGNYFERIQALYDEAGADSETLLMPLRRAIINGMPYSGVISFSGKEEYICCTKIPNSDWFMVTYMPYGILNEAIDGLNAQSKFAEIFTLLSIIALFVVLQILYSRVSRKQYAELADAHNATLSAQNELKRLVKLNEELSVTDYLTHLPNRRGLDKFVDDHWSKWSGASEEVAFLTLDIDNLKYINDTFGHKEGDWTISTFGEIVDQITAGYGITARTGGDEFLAVLMVDADTARKIMNAIYTKLDEINSTGEKPYKLYASIGFYDTPIGKDISYDECVRLSDEEMYKVKRKHRRAYSDSTAGMGE